MSATCQRPQVTRAISGPPGRVVRSGFMARFLGLQLGGREVAGDRALLGEDAARPEEEDRAEAEADQHDAEGGGAGLLVRREERSDGRGGESPQRPDDDGAEDGAAVVA